LWEDNKAVVEWLSRQLELDQWDQSVLKENIKSVERDFVMHQMRRYLKILSHDLFDFEPDIYLLTNRKAAFVMDVILTSILIHTTATQIYRTKLDL